MKRLRPRPLETRPTVSVVIPCYNYGHYLPDAVTSALDQPGVDVDVLIVDDASPDGSARVAHELAAADHRVRVLAHVTNKGHIATYNEGLALARGDYVVLLSADDLLTPGCLTRATALLERHPDMSFAYGYAETFRDVPPEPRTAVTGWSVWSGEEWNEAVSRTARNVIVNPEVVMRRSVMAELGGYDAKFPHAADLELWLRAATLGSVGRINGTDQAFYRHHGGNMHLTDYGSLLLDLRERLAVFDQVLTADGAPRHRAARALAREAVRLAWQANDAGGAHGGASVADFCGFAVAAWPDVVRTATWRALQRRLGRHVPAWQKLAAAHYLRGRYHLWWRRWRRVGL
jgi:glycosyltransferase involved in cell wall biosynthesis